MRGDPLDPGLERESYREYDSAMAAKVRGPKKSTKRTSPATGDERKVKRSFTLDRKVDEEARRRIGARGLSAFVNDAIKRRLQGLRIEAWLDEREAIDGPIPDAAFSRVDDALKRAGF